MRLKIVVTFLGLSGGFIPLALYNFSSKLLAEEAVTAIFDTPKSMLETAERLLEKEKDPAKRLEILFRWIKIKEDYEISLQKQNLISENPLLVEAFTQSKKDVVEKLLSELPRLSGHHLPLDRLHRELAFRLLDQKRYLEAKSEIEALNQKNSDDELAYGDALIGAKLTSNALEAYHRAGLDERLKTIAAYKRAWAYLSLSDFSNSLKEFDLSLEDYPNSPAKMREEAFKDRIRPYIETFSKIDFEEGEATELKKLSLKVHPINESKGEKNILFQESLKNLIQGFNAKNDIKKAQQVFNLLIKEVPKDGDEATEVLISVSPLWLKIHRSRLEHDAVERVLNNFPTHEIDSTKATALYAELNNTAAFYETLVSDRSDEKQMDPKARALLNLIYKKYFIFFPKDPEADSLRVNYGRLLLQDGDAESCLSVLNGRFKKQPEVEKIAFGLEAQCNLKYLDQLYAREHGDFFYEKLDAALIKDKLYKRPEIGVPEFQAFQGLSQMLIGAIKKNTKSSLLRTTLANIISNYPYDQVGPLLRDLKILSAELKFEDLAIAEIDTNEKAKAFFVIHQETPADTSVGLKSLRNSVLLTTEREGIERCDRFKQIYYKEFEWNGDIYKRCLSLAERYLDLEKELSYWKLYETSLDETQSIRVALLEMALGHENWGIRRLSAMKSNKSKMIQDFWYGTSETHPALNPKIVKLENNTEAFIKGLRKVAFAKIGKIVPIMISNFKAIDREWIKSTKLDGNKSLAMAKALSNRALIATRMLEWMKTLPEPSGLNAEELKLYKEKAHEILKPWEEQAEQAVRECSETAYALTPEFESSASCPEQTRPAIWNDLMGKWEQTRQARTIEKPWTDAKGLSDEERLFKILFAAGSHEENKLKAKYFLIRAYDMAKNNHDKALTQLAVAKILDKDRFWRTAAELDGNLTDAILWLKTRANGNPFYERLYDTQIDLVTKGEHFAPVGSASAAIDPLAKY